MRAQLIDFPDASLNELLDCQLHYQPIKKLDTNPRSSDIKQGSIGNCYLLSMLKMLAHRNPEFISNMVYEGPDHKIHVRLFRFDNDELKPVIYILDPTIVNSSEKNLHKANWPFMIEKAYAIHRVLQAKKGTYTKKSYAQVLEAGHVNITLQELIGQENKPIAFKRFTHPLHTLLLNEDLYFSCIEPNIECLKEEKTKTTVRSIEHSIHRAFTTESEHSPLAAWKSIFGEVLTTVLTKRFQLSEEAATQWKKTTPEIPANNYLNFHRMINWIIRFDMDEDIILRRIQTIWPNETTETHALILNKLKTLASKKDDQLTALIGSLKDALKSGEFITITMRDRLVEPPPGIVQEHAFHFIDLVCRQHPNGNKKYYAIIENPWARNILVKRFYNEYPLVPSDSDIAETQDKLDHYQKEELGIFEIAIEDLIPCLHKISVTLLSSTPKISNEHQTTTRNCARRQSTFAPSKEIKLPEQYIQLEESLDIYIHNHQQNRNGLFSLFIGESAERAKLLKSLIASLKCCEEPSNRRRLYLLIDKAIKVNSTHPHFNLSRTPSLVKLLKQNPIDDTGLGETIMLDKLEPIFPLLQNKLEENLVDWSVLERLIQLCKLDTSAVMSSSSINFN